MEAPVEVTGTDSNANFPLMLARIKALQLDLRKL
jgi:hypothetical protein